MLFVLAVSGALKDCSLIEFQSLLNLQLHLQIEKAKKITESLEKTEAVILGFERIICKALLGEVSFPSNPKYVKKIL